MCESWEVGSMSPAPQPVTPQAHLKRIEVVGTPIEKARFKFPTLTQLTTA